MLYFNQKIFPMFFLQKITLANGRSVLISTTFVNIIVLLFFLVSYLFWDGLQPSHIDGKQIGVFARWNDERVFSKIISYRCGSVGTAVPTTTARNPINVVSYPHGPAVSVKTTSQKRRNNEITKKKLGKLFTRHAKFTICYFVVSLYDVA